MPHYERRLPHFDLVGHPLFVTFRLHGSLPSSRIFPPGRLTSGEAFAAIDRILDKASTGPRYLAIPEIAGLVVASILAGESRFHRYELGAFAVMPNHVHLLVTPRAISTEWLGPLKGFTAHEANRILGRTGHPFWQDESYDHIVRAGAELERIRCYIENNPVKAGLVAAPRDFPWSSAQAA
jgi:REP element-mobilizing transposase RayT